MNGQIAGDGAALADAVGPLTKGPKREVSDAGRPMYLGDKGEIGKGPVYQGLTYLGEPDARFDTLEKVVEHFTALAARERDVRVPFARMAPGITAKEEFGMGFDGGVYPTTKLSDQQLTGTAKIPFEYWARMSPGLKVANMAEMLGKLNGERAKERLVRMRDDRIRALLSDRYTPISKLDTAQATKTLPGLKLHAAWDSASALHLYLYDPELEIPSPQPTGPEDNLYLGLHLWNSEVGTTSFGYDLHLMRAVCCNYNVWGYDSLTRDRVAHVSYDNLRRAITNLRWLGEGLRDRVRDAQAVAKAAAAETMLDAGAPTDKLLAALRKAGFAEGVASGALEQAQREFGGKITRWSLVQGLTWVSQKQGVDERTAVDRLAGKVLVGAALK